MKDIDFIGFDVKNVSNQCRKLIWNDPSHFLIVEELSKLLLDYESIQQGSLYITTQVIDDIQKITGYVDGHLEICLSVRERTTLLMLLTDYMNENSYVLESLAAQLLIQIRRKTPPRQQLVQVQLHKEGSLLMQYIKCLDSRLENSMLRLISILKKVPELFPRMLKIAICQQMGKSNPQDPLQWNFNDTQLRIIDGIARLMLESIFIQSSKSRSIGIDKRSIDVYQSLSAYFIAQQETKKPSKRKRI